MEAIPSQAMGERPHTVEKSRDRSSSRTVGFALQVIDLIMQSQSSLSGVGGSFRDACQSLLMVGQGAFAVFTGV